MDYICHCCLVFCDKCIGNVYIERKLSNVRIKSNPLFLFCINEKCLFILLFSNLIKLHDLWKIDLQLMLFSNYLWWSMKYFYLQFPIFIIKLKENTRNMHSFVYSNDIIYNYIVPLLRLTLPQESWQKSNQVTIVDSDITP